MEEFAEARGKIIVEALGTMIHENRGYLSEIDGVIGDGDHGINMDKGFKTACYRLQDQEVGLSASFKILGDVLVDEIGGSMGPLYGTFFKRMARVASGKEEINAEVLEQMIQSAYQGILSISEAKVGDKTLVDTLDPATQALCKANSSGLEFSKVIDAMIFGAKTGWESTKDLVARVGRASRLGERSRGALDAGATSCYLILRSIGESMKELAK